MSKKKYKFFALQSYLNLINCGENNISVKRLTNDSSKQECDKTATLSSIPPQCIVYHSIQAKTRELANFYAETDMLSHRYLAYRDIPYFIKLYAKGSHALDYGTGTGISAVFLHSLGLNVIGVDINSVMLKKARESFPHIEFLEIEKLIHRSQFDLIFSSFVLFDMKSKEEIVNYLNLAVSFMKEQGICIAITGSEQLYSVSRNWIAYDSNFDENRDLRSGDIARLRLKEPTIEFFDYFWMENDYSDCFQKANLKILKVHKPLGSEKDPYFWQDEKFCSPFTVYILQKQ